MKQNVYEVQKNIEKLLRGGMTGFLTGNVLNEVKSKLKKGSYSEYIPFEEAEKIILYTSNVPNVRLFKISCYKDDTLKHSSIMGSLFGLNITSEIPLLLSHMVLSHHGEKDYGSPVPPLTKEALILHFVDDLDSKMNIISKALESTVEGEFTQRLIAMDGRAFYKPKIK